MHANGSASTVVVFGGNSDIAAAVVRRLEDAAPHLRVVLAVRDCGGGTQHTSKSVVAVESYDATDTSAAARVLAQASILLGDIDLVIIAAGVLTDQGEVDENPILAGEMAMVNYVGAIVAGTAAAKHLGAQGGGQICVLSSIAGVRVRPSMPVYGSTKAGVDAFFVAAGRRWASSGISVLLVRPGFVKTKMTAGLQAAPFSTTPDQVAEYVVSALRNVPPGSLRICWAPRVLRLVAVLLRWLPASLLDRVDR